MLKTSPRSSRGVTMLEVLIAIFILTIGLLGVAGLQSSTQTAEVEAYQRAQAIVLLQDMVDRVNANRRNAAAYVTGATPLGVDTGLLDCTGITAVADRDKCEWNNALVGASETKAAASLGAMNYARGCITNPVAVMPREVVVAVVWQGIRPTVVPGSTTCGQGSYGDDATRRAMVAHVIVGCLENDPGSGACVTP
jgi:type IV pilus assembly protein PilV